MKYSSHLKNLWLSQIKETISLAFRGRLDIARIVFLMVSIRKIIESNSKYSFPLLKFYCDWVLHHKKDYRNKPFLPVCKGIATGGVGAFFDMSNLRKEFIEFLKIYKIPLKYIKDGLAWASICQQLSLALEGQIITNPCPNIERLCFKYISPIGPIIEMKLKNKKSGLG